MVYFRLKSNFGNWLFQYANAISLGKGECIGVIGEKDQKKLEKIRNSADLLSGLKIVNNSPMRARVIEETSFKYKPLLVSGNEDVLLDGYFQSEKYFDCNLVRDKLSVSPERYDYLVEKYKDWLSMPNVTSIHVRRGDYLRLQYKHPFVGKSYFKRAIAKMPECNNFIVFSDDIKWCKKFFPTTFSDKKFVFSEGNPFIDDFQLQSLCENNIISNSSFSWWASWLNKNKGKRVIAPSKWFGFAVHGEENDWHDIYYDGVEIVENHYSAGDWMAGVVSWMWLNCKSILRARGIVRCNTYG